MRNVGRCSRQVLVCDQGGFQGEKSTSASKCTCRVPEFLVDKCYRSCLTSTQIVSNHNTRSLILFPLTLKWAIMPQLVLPSLAVFEAYRKVREKVWSWALTAMDYVACL